MRNQDDLPQGWTSSTVADTCERVVVGFVGPSVRHYSEDGVPFLTGKNVRPGRLLLSDYDRVTRAFHEREAKSQLSPRDVVIVRIGRSGEAAVVPAELGQANCGGLVIAKQPRAVLPEYLAWYLNSPQGQAELLEEVRGVTRQTLNTKSIARATMPVAPLAEQRRIVAKIEALLADVRASRERLISVSAILKRLRRAVLAAACSGGLTKEWRETRHDFEPAVLDKRADEVRRRHWAERWPNRRYEPVPPVSERELSESDVPPVWGQLPFESFIAESLYGPRFAEADYVADGVPTVRTTDMTTDGRIDLRDPPRVRLSAEESRRFVLRDGDLLVTRTGSIGRCALVEGGLGKAIPSAYLIRFRLTDGVILPRFALVFLLSPEGQSMLGAGATAVTQPNINAKTIGRFPMPVPSLAEQQEIVRRVDALFALADKIEKQVAAATARADRLTPAILAKAFRGELVPTEAELAHQEGCDYEPASVLLERIRGLSAGTSSTQPVERTQRHAVPRQRSRPRARQTTRRKG